MKKLAVIILTVLVSFILGGTIAQASTHHLQLEVDQVLSEHPGGVQTGPGEITWNDGEVILNLQSGHDETELSHDISPFSTVGSCASGYFCGFTSTGLAGSKISFSSCTASNSVSPLGSAVRSVANARNSGTVYAYNGSSAVLSVAANSWNNTSATITRLGC